MKFILRSWQSSDIDSLIKYAHNAKIANYLTNAFPYPYTKESGEAFLQMACSQPEKFFAIDIDGEAIGSIGIFPQSDIHCLNAEIGYWLAEPFWGNGIITAAVRQIVDYGFRTFRLTRIFARPFGSNKASQRVLQKADFQLEARFEGALLKNGRIEDELIYAIRNIPK